MRVERGALNRCRAPIEEKVSYWGYIRNCSKTTSFKMMNNANDGAEAAHSKSFLYPFERIRKISVARVHWMWFFDQSHYQHSCHRLRLSADVVEYLLRTFLSWQMSFLSDWWIYLLPEKHICYPINANISSCCLPFCAVSEILLPCVSSTDVDSTVPLGLCGAMVGYKVESRADETTNWLEGTGECVMVWFRCCVFVVVAPRGFPGALAGLCATGWPSE